MLGRMALSMATAALVSTSMAAAPNTSLATIPVGYFGGHHNQPTSARGTIPCPKSGCRPAANVKMLAKMRWVAPPPNPHPSTHRCRRDNVTATPAFAMEPIRDACLSVASRLVQRLTPPQPNFAGCPPAGCLPSVCRLVMIEKWEGHCCKNHMHLWRVLMHGWVGIVVHVQPPHCSYHPNRTEAVGERRKRGCLSTL